MARCMGGTELSRQRAGRLPSFYFETFGRMLMKRFFTVQENIFTYTMFLDFYDFLSLGLFKCTAPDLNCTFVYLVGGMKEARSRYLICLEERRSQK